jgi:hypothetical protein
LLEEIIILLSNDILIMAMSTISTINNFATSAQVTGPQYTFVPFTFPTTLGVGVMTINSPTYNYSGGSGATAYRNGSYLMMTKYNNSTNVGWRMFSLDTKFWMTGIIASNPWTFFNSTDGTVSNGTNLTYTRNAYWTTGQYIGGTGNSAQNVTTPYDTTSTSSGEYFHCKFPFPFVVQKLYITLGNSNIYGPRDIRILGSNNGLDWTNINLYSFTGTYTAGVEVLVFDLTGISTIPYTHHRFVFETNGGGNIIVITNCRIEGQAQTN